MKGNVVKRGAIMAVAASALAMLATVLVSGTASAHNVLTGSDPQQGAVLVTAPSRVSFRFNAPIQRSSYNTVAITGPGGTHWAISDVRVDGDDISAAVGSLGPSGRYAVDYRIVSADGHPVTGGIIITLTAAGRGRPMSSMVNNTGGSTPDGGVPAWIWLLVAAIVIVPLTVLIRRRGQVKASR